MGPELPNQQGRGHGGLTPTGLDKRGYPIDEDGIQGADQKLESGRKVMEQGASGDTGPAAYFLGAGAPIPTLSQRLDGGIEQPSPGGLRPRLS